MKPVLLCTFAHVNDLKLIVDYIDKNYVLERNSIYVFENTENPDELYCTYNVVSAEASAENTILIHRKKESNTLYTINALNTLIKSINSGVLDKSFIVDWENYRNSLLMTVNGDISIIGLTLKKVIRK